MAVIKSGSSEDQLVVDPLSKAARVTLYGSDGQELTGSQVQVTNFPETQAVSGPLTNSELRATPLDITIDTGALATEATLAAIKAKTDNIDVMLSTRTSPSDTQPIEGSVSVDNFPATQPVSGPLTNNELRASAVPVSGAFFQATQPIVAASLPLPAGASTESTLVSINTKIPSSPSEDRVLASAPSAVRLTDGTVFYKPTTPTDTQPVSGTFFQATQPVSGPFLTDAELRAAAVPVSGTFFQPTQPVSGPLTDSELRANAVPVSGPLTDVQLRAAAVPIAGTVAVSNLPSVSTLTGVYFYHSGVLAVQAAADAALAGRVWLINPIGSTTTLRIKTIQFECQISAAGVMPTSPRLTAARVTFTGTASGASLNPAKRKTSDASPQGSLRTASTGLSLTAGEIVVSFYPLATQANNNGFSGPAAILWAPEAENQIELVPGEGIVIRQPDTGTTADVRRYTIDITVEEF